MRYGETVLSRRVVRQPVPDIQPGGDCGACVLGGLLGKSVPEVYGAFRDGKAESFHWYEMKRALWSSLSRGWMDRIVEHVPLWPGSVPEMIASWGMHSGYQSLAWFAYVQMAIDAGYYGLAMVDFNKKGPWGGGTNHWVMLCGVRSRLEESDPVNNPGTGAVHNELLISCSAKSSPDEEWVDVSDFLIQRGGFNILLARPVT